MAAWRDLEIELRRIVLPHSAEKIRHFTIREMFESTGDANPFPGPEMNELRELQAIRNSVAHAMPNLTPLITAVMKKVRSYTSRLRELGKG